RAAVIRRVVLIRIAARFGLGNGRRDRRHIPRPPGLDPEALQLRVSQPVGVRAGVVNHLDRLDRRPARAARVAARRRGLILLLPRLRAARRGSSGVYLGVAGREDDPGRDLRGRPGPRVRVHGVDQLRKGDVVPAEQAVRLQAPGVGQPEQAEPDRYHPCTAVAAPGGSWSPSGLDGFAIWYAYPAMNTAAIAAAKNSGRRLPGPDTAQPVPRTLTLAAISPARKRPTLPALASWSWKNGDATVNHDGQNPANPPDASPISRIRITASS